MPEPDCFLQYRISAAMRNFIMRCNTSLQQPTGAGAHWMTFDGALINEVRVDSPILSDHSLVICGLCVDPGQATATEHLVHGWRQMDRDQLCRAIEDSALCQPRCTDDDDDVNELFATYDCTMHDIVDQLAPLHTVHCQTGHIVPWFDADCRSARRECRRLERWYLRTRTTDDHHRWVDAARRRSRLYCAKKESFWLDRLSQQGRSSSALWRSLSSMLGRDRDVSGTTSPTADGFVAFFHRKVDDVRASTAGQPPPSVHDTAHSTLSSFRLCTEPEVRRHIMKSPIKSCSLDPLPTFLLREQIDSMLPFITRIDNA